MSGTARVGFPLFFREKLVGLHGPQPTTDGSFEGLEEFSGRNMVLVATRACAGSPGSGPVSSKPIA